MPAPALKKTLRPKDFLLHQDYVLHEQQAEYDREWKQRHREDYYLTQVAYEVYLLRYVVSNMFSTTCRKPELKFEDFMLKVEDGKVRAAEKPKESESTQWMNEVHIKSIMDKAAVAACLGVKVPVGG